MVTTAVASGFAALAQSLASFYPILIKRVDTNILTQTTVRFVVYPLAALAIGGFGSFTSVTNSPTKLLIVLAAGLLNLTHVFSSYVAFDELQAGIAMSIFYTYPFWNMLGARLFLGETMQIWTFPLFALALYGTYLIATAASDSHAYKKDGAKEPNISRGVIAAVLAALTETGLYLTVRGSTTSNPFANIILLYLGGAAVILGALPIIKKLGAGELDLRASSLLPTAGFNTVFGVASAALLFYAARLLPAYMYSILAFVGVGTSFLYGLAFAM